jgi:hypothetical protein
VAAKENYLDQVIWLCMIILYCIGDMDGKKLKNGGKILQLNKK